MIKFLISILLNGIGIGLLLVVIIVPGLPQFRTDRRVDDLLTLVLRSLGNTPCGSRAIIRHSKVWDFRSRPTV